MNWSLNMLFCWKVQRTLFRCIIWESVIFHCRVHYSTSINIKFLYSQQLIFNNVDSKDWWWLTTTIFWYLCFSCFWLVHRIFSATSTPGIQWRWTSGVPEICFFWGGGFWIEAGIWTVGVFPGAKSWWGIRLRKLGTYGYTYCWNPRVWWLDFLGQIYKSVGVSGTPNN